MVNISKVMRIYLCASVSDDEPKEHDRDPLSSRLSPISAFGRGIEFNSYECMGKRSEEIDDDGVRDLVF